MRTYRKIIEIAIRHNYYLGGELSSKDLGFFKTAETEKLLTDYRLMLKFNANRIELIQECELEDGKLEPFIEITEELKLNIVVQQKNKQLFSFTELPFLQMGKELFYFSNHVGGKLKNEGKLSRKDSISQDDVCFLLPKSSIQITDAVGDKPFVLVGSSIQLQFGSISEMAARLVMLEDGFYQLKQNDKVVFSFVLLKKKYSTADIALLNIHIDKKIGKSIHGEPKQFTIDFEARKLHWQYQVFERFNSIKNIEIIDEKSNIEFTEQETVEAKGKLTKSFITKQPIALTEGTKYEFKIVSPNNGRAAKVWVERLPLPKLSNITKNGDKLMVFKEFVYL